MAKAKVHRTVMPALHTLLAKEFTDLLVNGVILEDQDGHPIMVDGQPLRRRPSAAELGQIRQFLKDNEITGEDFELEGSPVEETQKALRTYDDEPLLIPERDGVPKQIA